MVPTVRENMEGFTKQKRQKATLAREAQEILGHVSATELDFLVKNKKRDELPLNFANLDHSKQMFGPSRAEVMGKTVRLAPDRVEPEYIAIPKDFILLH